MHVLTAVFVLFTVVFMVISKLFNSVVIFSLFVTFLTFSYHFVMRLLVGFGTRFFPERLRNCTNFWFKPKKFENKIYKFLKVKKWKGKVPAYYPESFSVEKHTLDEIAATMCGAEITHEIIVVFSFIPILFSLKFGVPAVFIITSCFAAAIDMVFVIIQRYNRPRILRLIKRK